MSQTDFKGTKILMYLKDDNWDNSIESIALQKTMRLTRSESLLKTPFEFGSNTTLAEFELRKIEPEEFIGKEGNREIHRIRSGLPLTQPRNTMADELEILKINLSAPDNALASRRSTMISDVLVDVKRRKSKKLANYHTKTEFFFTDVRSKISNLLTEIEGSELAKTDTVIWKFLKRGVPFRKEILKAKKFLIEIQTLKLSDPYIQNTQPTKITCPNCNFFVTTNIKKVSTTHTKLFAMVFTVIRLCVSPQIFYSYKDTVHICPLCKIYLGFCPAFGIWNRRRISRALEQQKMESKLESEKMVSASSTSAKNLFVESKLRLSDRVQVNVNNIAAVARQIQRGSKANENLIGAAKNFALQEPAIENSETNLKKLKLLSTHINNQLESIHNSSLKMESVLEQVRSMQR